jgi:hypothetical protein
MKETCTRTVELKLVQERPSRYTWGKVTAIHTIGPYSIIEFQQWTVRGCTVNVGETDFRPSAARFDPYYNGKRMGACWRTLEHALLHLISYRATSSTGEQAVEFAARVLNLRLP